MKLLKKTFSIFIILTFTGISISCGSSTSSRDVTQKLSYAETEFVVQVPSPLASDESLVLEVLDEVTGIALNPERFKLNTSDGFIFNVRLPLAIGSVLRYRYVKNGQASIIERDTNGNQIQYRLYRVADASIVRDYVANWDANPYPGITGELSGYVYNKSNDAPLPEILVVINGMRTFTSFDGFFKFERVPLGEYHLTALHPDGRYEVFQQNAVIAENSITPASFGLTAAKLVDVTFVISVPDGTDTNAGVRLIGNTYSLGNSFSELVGGASVVASRAPLLKLRSDGKYELNIQLPAGTDLRYKYTLGDGFINAEHDAENQYITRQLIIPSKNVTINDTISTWYSQGTYPVNFIVTVPENTPTQDSVSIQLNPFVWLQPIPMWKTGPNQWAYSLYGPFEYLNNSQYRFCRNNQCSLTDDEVTKGKNASGYQLVLEENQPLTINYQINQWFGLQPVQYGLESVQFPAQSSFFIKGFQFNELYDYQWLPALDTGLIDMGVSGANWLFFSPTWSFSKVNNSSNGLIAGVDAFSADILKIKEKASEAGLTFAVYPQINPFEPEDFYWSSSGISYNWWQNWFDQYERMILNYVDFSESHGVNTIIIGGSSVAAGFPSGKLPNGENSNTPYDFKDRWSQLVEKMRSRFSGQIGFAIPYSSFLNEAPQMIASTDFIVLEFNSALSESNSPTVAELESRFNSLLDQEIYKLYATFQKPVILGINFTSFDGTAANCANSGTSCENLQNGAIDIAEQADVYQAILRASITKPWIYGLISMGFNPAANVQDESSSVNGKLAMQVLSYYFNNLK